MNCSKCGHQFCWLCKGPWDQHGSQTGGYYVCNKYNEDVRMGTVGDEEKKTLFNQKLLQKYEYYYKRYKSAIESIKFTNAIHQRIEKATASLDIPKYAYLTEAVDKLIEARRVLQWTYCMAYFLREGNKKSLFEYQQTMLVGNTEALTGLIEGTDMDKLMSLEMRNDIVNKSRTMEKFRSEMVGQVERGEFEELLLSTADTSAAMWTCASCKADNTKDAYLCIGCTACQKHGELECKACKKH